MQQILHDVPAGFLVGLLSVFLVVYAFQPNRPYPSWVLAPAEQPWIFILIILAIIYLIRWDYLVGLLAVLCVLAVILDLVIFTAAGSSDKKGKEGLYIPSISLIPDLGKGKEGFDNQKVVPKVLPEDDQVSKKWTTNESPSPYELSRNSTVGSSENSKHAMASGVPLSYLNDKGYYPIFE